MPTIEINGVDLNYTDTGPESGPEKQTIVFSHGLLMSAEMFASQVAHLSGRYRCIAYEHRGQAGSGTPAGGYDMDTVADDAAKLIDALGVGPCHFVGLSMGGFVGMRLAIRRPELLRSLTLLDTSADAEHPFNRLKYRLMNVIARTFGLGIVAPMVMPQLFGKSFLADPARARERAHWRRYIASHDRVAITAAVSGVVERAAVQDQLSAIDLPTLVIVGEEGKSVV